MPITLNGTSGLVTPGMTLGSSVVDVPSGSAPSYLCRAWVNFNGTSTVAIRASANVTSLTDNGTGDYTVNLTTAMPDANYAVVTGGKQDDTYNDRFFSTKVVNTSSFRMYFAAYSIGLYDPTYAHAAIFR